MMFSHIMPPDGFTTPAPTVVMTVCTDPRADICAVSVNAIPLALVSNSIWRTSVALVTGENRFAVSALASNGVITSTSVTYFRSSTTRDGVPPPSFSFVPPDGSLVVAPAIEMGILVRDKRETTAVTVDGRAASCLDYNSWRCHISLLSGTNRFCVVAQFTDQSCATSHVTYFYRTSQMGGDTMPPAILSVWPPDGSVTTNATLLVRLRIVDNHGVASVRVNEQPATPVLSNIWLAALHLAPGSNTALVLAEDFAGNTATQLLSYLRALPPVIISTALPPAVLDAPYTVCLEASGGVPPLQWTASPLPPGIVFSNDWLVGSPAVTGTFPIAVTVFDSLGRSDHTLLSMVVQPVIRLLTTQLPDAYVAQPYAFRLLADGGEDPVSWSAASVPLGLSVLDNGQIYGTPASTGKFELIITVTDSRGRSLTQPVPILVKEISEYNYLLLATAGGALPEVPAGDSCALSLPITSVLAIRHSSVSIPGVSISSDGRLQGRPAPGFYVFPAGASASWVWSVPPRLKDSLGSFSVQRLTLSSHGVAGSLRLRACSPLPPGVRLQPSLPVVLSLGGFTVVSTTACVCSTARYRAVFPFEGGSASLSIALTSRRQLAWSLSLRRIPRLADRVTRFSPDDGCHRLVYATVLLGPHAAHTVTPLPK